jgi:membrane protease YdiL (CAAX protease family)
MTPTADNLGARYLVVLSVVGAWMLLGFWLHLSGNAYLLAGVPILLAFQVLVARRPIGELWFRGPAPAPMPRWCWAVAAAFLAFPVYSLVHLWARSGWDERLWHVCAAAGAFPLGFSFGRISLGTLRVLAMCLATAGLLGVLFVLGPAWIAHHHAGAAGAARQPLPFTGPFGPKLAEMARSFFLYLPVVFLLEEVFFRGGLDSYLHRSDDRDPWVSAGFVSALWGLWHMPLILPGLLHLSMAPAAIGFVTVAVIAVHYSIGIPLTVAWRRSGLLFVPGLVHALIDTVRNGAAIH